jgi:hypothetical protein
MSEQETVGTGVEESPTHDDLGNFTEEALIDRLMEAETPAPVESQEGPEEGSTEEAEIDFPETGEEDGSEEAEEEAINENYEEDSEEELQVFTVKVDGIEQEVNLDELRRGYSGQQYIQQQMGKVAETRKEAETIYSQLAHERMQVQQALQMLTDGTLAAPPVAPDEALFNTDPLAYMERKLQFDKDNAQYQERLGYLQQQVQANQEQHQGMRHAYLAREAEILQGYHPELFDEQGGQETRDKLVGQAAEAYGFTSDELVAVGDHRHIRVLMDALKYQQLNSESGKKRVEQKVQKKTVRSSKRKVNAADAAQRKQREKLKASGSIEDALDLLLTQ